MKLATFRHAALRHRDGTRRFAPTATSFTPFRTRQLAERHSPFETARREASRGSLKLHGRTGKQETSLLHRRPKFQRAHCIYLKKNHDPTTAPCHSPARANNSITRRGRVLGGFRSSNGIAEPKCPSGTSSSLELLSRLEFDERSDSPTIYRSTIYDLRPTLHQLPTVLGAHSSWCFDGFSEIYGLPYRPPGRSRPRVSSCPFAFPTLPRARRRRGTKLSVSSVLVERPLHASHDHAGPLAGRGPIRCTLEAIIDYRARGCRASRAPVATVRGGCLFFSARTDLDFRRTPRILAGGSRGQWRSSTPSCSRASRPTTFDRPRLLLCRDAARPPTVAASISTTDRRSTGLPSTAAIPVDLQDRAIRRRRG